MRQKGVPWESSQHARTLAAQCPVRLATTAAGDPIIAANGLAVAKGEEKAGMRPRGAEGRGLALRRGAVEAVRPRTAERREREATPRHDMARVSPEESGTVLVGVVEIGRAHV